jgi:hypothetical protein
MSRAAINARGLLRIMIVVSGCVPAAVSSQMILGWPPTHWRLDSDGTNFCVLRGGFQADAKNPASANFGDIIIRHRDKSDSFQFAIITSDDDYDNFVKDGAPLRDDGHVMLRLVFYNAKGQAGMLGPLPFERHRSVPGGDPTGFLTTLPIADLVPFATGKQLQVLGGDTRLMIIDLSDTGRGLQDVSTCLQNLPPLKSGG